MQNLLTRLLTASEVRCLLLCSNSSSLIIMLRLEELAFIKAFSTTQLSPAILKELRMALSRRKNMPVVPVGMRSIISTSGAGDPQRLLAGKRKAK